jgi:hypothetical protein
MNTTEILKNIGLAFEESNYPINYIDSGEKIIPERTLVVIMGGDDDGRGYVLHLVVLKGDPEQKEILPSENLFIHLFIPFPFRSEEASSRDVGSLLHYLNRMLDLPGLGIDELENLIFYKYVFKCRKGTFELDEIVDSVRMMAIRMEILSSTIELIASGEQSIAEYFAEIAEKLKADLEQ